MKDEYPGTAPDPTPKGPGSPEDGHQFHFEIKVQGSYGITGDPQHYDADLFPGPGFQLTVRAWSLQEACGKAAQVPLPGWQYPEEAPVADALTERLAESLAEITGLRGEAWATVSDVADEYALAHALAERGLIIDRAQIGEHEELLHAIWLYVKWRYVTKQLTTEQKNLWADAVEKISEQNHPGDGIKVDRWWSTAVDQPPDEELPTEPASGLHRGPDGASDVAPRSEEQ